MMSRRRIVFDTNVLVSAVLTSQSTAHRALLAASRQGFFLFSRATFEEFEDVLYRSKFDRYITNPERRQFTQDLLAKSVQVQVTEHLTVCSDPDDDKFLELAVSAKADGIVTGNLRDFPASPFRGIPILSPAMFLESALAG